VKDGVPVELDERQAVADLPDQVGEKDEKRDSRSRPGPSAQESFPGRREDKPDSQGREIKCDGVLVLEGDTHDQPQGGPEPRAIVLQNDDQDICCQRPEQDIEGVVGEEDIEVEDDAGQDNTNNRNKLLTGLIHKNADAWFNSSDICDISDKQISHSVSESSSQKTGIFTLRASRSGRIRFVAKGSQYRAYSFTLRASHPQPPRLVNMPG
jgi:hypothetical protein